MNSVLLSLLVFSIFLSVCLAKGELHFGLCNCYRQWKIVDCSNRHLTDTVIEGFAAVPGYQTLIGKGNDFVCPKIKRNDWKEVILKHNSVIELFRFI